MARLVFILDTTVISDSLNNHPAVSANLQSTLAHGDILGFCLPVHYEVLRGLLRVNATRKLHIFNTVILPTLDPVDVTKDDWMLAAQYWADTQRQGRQLSDTDLVIAALAQRWQATIVSSDADFDALPIARVDWRVP